ncbi:uncharacterized protein O3C94_015629 [Discoglossus pictus]
MCPLSLLVCLCLSGIHCDSHSLQYYYTGVSAPGHGLPTFSAVGYVDDIQILHYDSDTLRARPMVHWMEEIEDERDYWEINTELSKAHEISFQRGVRIAMSRFNQTGGLHSFQMMYGCELDDDGKTRVHEQYAYDGRDFLSLDTDQWVYVPFMNEAQITTERWNRPDLGDAETTARRAKTYLEEDCIDWLRKYVRAGREELEKRVLPRVKISHHQSDGVTKLHCQVYGFYPRDVDVKWVKNEIDDVYSEEGKQILPNPDGTYQTRVTVEVTSKEEDSYYCHVDHSSLIMKHIMKWDPPKDNIMPIVAGVIGGIIAAVVIGLVYMMRSVYDHQLLINNATYVQYISLPHAPGLLHTEHFWLLIRFSNKLYTQDTDVSARPASPCTVVWSILCHSLHYYFTAVSTPNPELPVYSIVGYVDDMVFGRYNSKTRRAQPLNTWMKERVDHEHWETQTNIAQYYEERIQHDARQIHKLFNKTYGLSDGYTYQVKFACELNEDGTTDGYEEFGYNGKEFIFFDKKNAQYIPITREAQIIVPFWGGQQRQKDFIEKDCIGWMKKYLMYGKDELESKVPPKVKVSGHQSGEVTKLHCMVYGFYPRSVDVKWVKNGIDNVYSEEAKQILPNPDGTFQIRVTVLVTPQDKDIYTCHVDHGSLEETLIVKWERHNRHFHYIVIALIAAGLIVSCALGILVYKRMSHK